MVLAKQWLFHKFPWQNYEVFSLIYVTGDTHGDLSRFGSRAVKKLKKNDTLIICGDFGFLWQGGKPEEKVLRKLGKKKFNILFLDGANDNLNLIEKYPETDWNDGRVRVISGRLMYAMRGSVYNIDAQTVFAFGGGYADEEDLEGKDSDSREKSLPTLGEIQIAKDNLEKHGYKVDYIITHQASRKLKNLLSTKNEDASTLDVFFDMVREKVEYRCWCFGSLHINKVIPPNELVIFEDVVKLSPDFSPLDINAKKRAKIFKNHVDF